MDDVKEMVIDKTVYTLFLIFLTLCNLLAVLSIIVCVWVISYISSVFEINSYPINILLMLSEIGSICIFIIFTITDILLVYKIHLKT